MTNSVHERITARQFHHAVGVEDWRVADGGACAHFRTGSFAAGARLVGGFPLPDGHQFMTGLQPEGDGVPFPGWEAFEGADSADIDEPTRRELLERFIPSPVGVITGTVRLTDDRRYEVPATGVCPEYSRDDLKELILAEAKP